MATKHSIWRSIFYTGTVLSGLCAAGFAGPLVVRLVSLSSRPRLAAEPPIITLGEIAEGSVITQTVTLRNTSNTPITVSRIKTSCGCTTASSVPPLAVGETALLHIRFDAHGKAGKNQQFVWLFVKGEPNAVAVALRADIAKAFQVSPSPIVLGTLASSSRKKAFFSLQSLDNKKLHVLHIEAEDPIRITNWRQAENKAQVDLEVIAPPIPGDYQKMVTVSVDHPVQHQIVVPVRFHAVGLYHLDKPAFNFGNVTNSQSVTDQIDITGADVEGFALAHLPPGITADIRRVSAQHTILSIQFNPKGGSSQILNDAVSVVTKNPQQPRIRIPVYAAVSSSNGAR